MVFSYSFESLQKVTLGTLGCRPRARSILRCHGDLVLRHGPLTAVARARSVLRCHGDLVLRHGPLTAVAQDESQLQEDASKFAVGSAEKQAKSWFSASFESLQKVTLGTLGCRLRA